MKSVFEKFNMKNQSGNSETKARNESEEISETSKNLRVLETYNEMAKLAVKEDTEYSLYLNRKQAYEEFQTVLQSGLVANLHQQDLKELMVCFYKGVDLHYSENRNTH